MNRISDVEFDGRPRICWLDPNPFIAATETNRPQYILPAVGSCIGGVS
jgi:hypothetical protein